MRFRRRYSFTISAVGRGVFDAANKRVNITANLPAIATSGLPAFYLEAEEFDAQRKVLERTRARLEELERRVAELEARAAGPGSR